MSKYRFFEDSELSCHCDKCKDNPTADNMDEGFMNTIVRLRESLGFAFPVSSAYRCPNHPVERNKETPGAHTSGKAIDILVSGPRAYKILRESFDADILGIGVSQTGKHNSRFIHLDQWVEGPRPAVWSY